MRLLKVLGGIVLILVVLAAGGAALLAAIGLPYLDRVLAREVREEFALPDDSQVAIRRGSLAQTLAGYVPSFTVDADSASLDGLAVEDLHFKAESIKFDLSKLRTEQQAELEHAERGEISFKVSDDALLEHWRTEIEDAGLSDPSIEIDSKGAKVAALIDFKLMQARLAAKGVFEVDGSRRVRFRVREVEVAGMNFNIGGFKAALSKLTPILELDQFKMEIRVDELSTSDGYLHVRGNSVPAEEAGAEDTEETSTDENETGNATNV